MLLRTTERKKLTKKIFVGNLSASELSIHKLVNDLESSHLEDSSI